MLAARKQYEEMGGMADENVGLNTILEDSKLSNSMQDNPTLEVYAAKKDDRRPRGDRLSRG